MSKEANEVNPAAAEPAPDQEMQGTLQEVKANTLSTYPAWKAKVENSVDWVRGFIKRGGLVVQPNRTFLKNGVQVKSSEILREIKIAYDLDFKQCFNFGFLYESMLPQRTANEILALALEQYVDSHWANFLAGKVRVLQHDPALDFSELTRFVEACTGATRDLDLAVMAHWLWQVKRKMTAQTVTNHIMPIFIGSQGSGKSTAVEKLLSCIGEYRADISVSALADERNYHSLEESFVIVCDEMQGCDRTDVDRLKNMITASVTTARKLYTNVRDKIPQNASLIGTSNKMIELLIKDDTGLRRFHVVPCAAKMAWNVLNSIDYLKIWKAIDESKVDGYISRVLPQLRDEQEANRVATPVEDYLRETKAIPTTGTQTKNISVHDFFSDYCKWCEGAKTRPLDRGWFSKHLKQHGIGLTRTSQARLAVVSNDFVPWTLTNTAAIASPEP